MKGVGVERKGMCEELSNGYYGLCAVGGMLSAGTTHLAITPLDVLKVNMQVIFCIQKNKFFVHNAVVVGETNVVHLYFLWILRFLCFSFVFVGDQ